MVFIFRSTEIFFYSEEELFSSTFCFAMICNNIMNPFRFAKWFETDLTCFSFCQNKILLIFCFAMMRSKLPVPFFFAKWFETEFSLFSVSFKRNLVYFCFAIILNKVPILFCFAKLLVTEFHLLSVYSFWLLFSPQRFFKKIPIPFVSRKDSKQNSHILCFVETGEIPKKRLFSSCFVFRAETFLTRNRNPVGGLK